MKNRKLWIVLAIYLVCGMTIGAIHYVRKNIVTKASPEDVKAQEQTISEPLEVSTEALAETSTEVTTAASTEELTEEVDNGDVFEDNGHPYMIKVNRKMNVVTVYTLDEEGFYTVPYKAMVCSVGLRNRTPRGTFKLQSDRYEWRELVGHVYGQYAVRIRKSIMFHSVPYYRPEKDRLESEEFNKLGEPASKGCVRLTVEDAKWIYENCEKGTLVQIFDSDYIGPLGKPKPPRLDLEDERSNYDPTDDDENNPWLYIQAPIGEN